MNILTKIISATTVFAVLILIFLSFKSANSQSDTILIRATQVSMGKHSYIKIYRGHHQITNIPIDKFVLGEEDTNYDKVFTLVRNYESQGYQIVSHSEMMYGGIGFVNTFILTKK